MRERRNLARGGTLRRHFACEPTSGHADSFYRPEPPADFVEANLAHCGVQTGYTVLGVAVARGLRTLLASPGFAPFDIVFFDPPYGAAPAEVLAGADAFVAPGGVLVLEHSGKLTAPESSGRLVRVREIASGDSRLTFYQVAAQASRVNR